MSKAKPATSTSATPALTPAPTPTPGYATVFGHVVHATNGSNLSGASVSIIDSANNTVFAMVNTDASGNYSIANVPIGNYKMGFSDVGFSTFTVNSPGTVVAGQSYNVNAALSPHLAVGQVRIVLTWTSQKSGAVRDIDSYLLEPGAVSNNPIYYFHKNGMYANLDIDQTNWMGPETVTINNLTGTFTYYIANWSDPSFPLALGNSSAVVSVYDSNGLIKQYTIPPYSGAGTGVVYEVFKITNGVIADRRLYDSPLYHCTWDGLPPDVNGTSGSLCGY